MPISSKAFSSGGSLARNIRRIRLETTPPAPIVDANNEIVELVYEPLELDASEGFIQIYIDRNFELSISEVGEGFVELFVNFESPSSNTETENSNRIKWHDNIEWQGGMEPPLPPIPSKTSMIKLHTIDSGQTWYGQREWFSDYSYMPSDHWEIACDFAGNTVEDSLVISGTVSEVDILEAGDHIVGDETYGRVYKLSDGMQRTNVTNVSAFTASHTIKSNPLGISVPVPDINKNRFLSVEGIVKISNIVFERFWFGSDSPTYARIYNPISVIHGANKPASSVANERLNFEIGGPNQGYDIYYNSSLQTNTKTSRLAGSTLGPSNSRSAGKYTFPVLNLLTKYVYDFQDQTITVYFDGKVSTYSIGQDLLLASSLHPQSKNHVIFGFGGIPYSDNNTIVYTRQGYSTGSSASFYTTVSPIYLDNIRIKSYN